MTFKKRYTVVIESSEEGGYYVWCPSLPGCHSQGDNLQEAKQNIIEAMQCHLESLIQGGGKPPAEHEEFVGSVEVSVTA